MSCSLDDTVHECAIERGEREFFRRLIVRNRALGKSDEYIAGVLDLTVDQVRELAGESVDEAADKSSERLCATASAKPLDLIAKEVKRTVIGQDGAVDWLCSFADAACMRSRIIREQGIDPLMLPSIGSALMIGATASGKSFLLKRFAKAADLLFYAIDAGQMSAESYKGASFSTHWQRLSAQLEANPGRMVLVFIDEVDKLLAQNREGSAVFDLLKPLEGGMLSGLAGKDEISYTLDCDRCIFVFAGAFTGIEDIVSRRLRGASSCVGFSGSAVPLPAMLSEADLRAQIRLEDVEAWGAPRELVGRFSTVRFLEPLDEETLRRIVHNNKQAEYTALLPGRGMFTIGAAAEDVLIERALQSHYGVRSLNQQLNELFCGEIWRAVEAAGTPVSVILTARDGELCFEVEEAPASSDDDVALQADSDKPITPFAHNLQKDVFRCVAKHKGKAPLDPHLTIGDNCAEFAAAILCVSDRVSVHDDIPYIPNNYSPAEITLLNAIFALLQDWFPEEDHTPRSMRILLSMSDGESSSETPLDCLFRQIKCGYRYIENSDYDSEDPSSRPWIWTKTDMVRDDGLYPAATDGLKAGQDRALDCYTEFKGFPLEAQELAILRLSFRLLQVDCCSDHTQEANDE